MLGVLFYMALLISSSFAVVRGNNDAETVGRFLLQEHSVNDPQGGKINVGRLAWEYGDVGDILSRALTVWIRYEKGVAIMSPAELTNHLQFVQSMSNSLAPYTILTNQMEYPAVNLGFSRRQAHASSDTWIKEMQKPLSVGFRIVSVSLALPGERSLWPFIVASFKPFFRCGCGGGGAGISSVLILVMGSLFLVAFVCAVLGKIQWSLWISSTALCFFLYLVCHAIEGSAGTFRALVMGRESCYSLPEAIYILLYDTLRLIGVAGCLYFPTLFVWLLRTPKGHGFAIRLVLLLMIVVSVYWLTLIRWELYGTMVEPVHQVFINHSVHGTEDVEGEVNPSHDQR
jgi:hypothetical protein